MLNEYNFENIYIRHAIDENPEPTHYNMHIHDRCEIYFFICGKVDYLVEGSIYPLDENSILIMRPSESHTAKILKNEKYERFAINFPLSFLQEFDTEKKLTKPFLDRALGKDNLFTESDLDMNLIKNLFFQMIDAKTFSEKKLTIHTHLGMILFLLQKAFSEKQKSEQKSQTISERAIKYVNKHLFEEITVCSIAEHFNLSTSQLTRIFKNNIGSSPWEYILRKRLTAAKEMISNGKTSQDACFECGFSDYSSFYRAYAKYFKNSPSSAKNTTRQNLNY